MRAEGVVPSSKRCGDGDERTTSRCLGGGNNVPFENLFVVGAGASCEAELPSAAASSGPGTVRMIVGMVVKPTEIAVPAIHCHEFFQQQKHLSRVKSARRRSRQG